MAQQLTSPRLIGLLSLKAAIIRTYVSANKLHAIRTYVYFVLPSSEYGSIKILPITLN